MILIRLYTEQVKILHSAEDENLFPFDLNIACLRQNIDIIDE